MLPHLGKKTHKKLFNTHLRPGADTRENNQVACFLVGRASVCVSHRHSHWSCCVAHQPLDPVVVRYLDNVTATFQNHDIPNRHISFSWDGCFCRMLVGLSICRSTRLAFREMYPFPVVSASERHIPTVVFRNHACNVFNINVMQCFCSSHCAAKWVLFDIFFHKKSIRDKLTKNLCVGFVFVLIF